MESKFKLNISRKYIITFIFLSLFFICNIILHTSNNDNLVSANDNNQDYIVNISDIRNYKEIGTDIVSHYNEYNTNFYIQYPLFEIEPIDSYIEEFILNEKLAFVVDNSNNQIHKDYFLNYDSYKFNFKDETYYTIVFRESYLLDDVMSSDSIKILNFNVNTGLFLSTNDLLKHYYGNDKAFSLKENIIEYLQDFLFGDADYINKNFSEYKDILYNNNYLLNEIDKYITLTNDGIYINFSAGVIRPLNQGVVTIKIYEDLVNGLVPYNFYNGKEIKVKTSKDIPANESENEDIDLDSSSTSNEEAVPATILEDDIDTYSDIELEDDVTEEDNINADDVDTDIIEEDIIDTDNESSEIELLEADTLIALEENIVEEQQSLETSELSKNYIDIGNGIIDVGNGRLIDSNKKMVALTFDDGPNPVHTNRILDTLEYYNIVATFFDLGKQVASYPDVVQRELDLGCEVGNHSYNHDDFAKLSAEQIRNDIQKTNDIFFDKVGIVPTIFRPPYGSTNQTVVDNVGMPSILWSIDTLDWKSRDANQIMNIIYNSGNLDGQVILMHGIYESSAFATEILVPYLLSEDYQFVTISELIEIYYGGFTDYKLYGYSYFKNLR